MDSMRGQFPGQDEPDTAASGVESAGFGPPPAVIGTDERRMQVRAYNFWASLLFDDRTFPDIASLHPADLADFGPYSVLLDFTDGIENPGISYLGERLAEECGAERQIRRLDEVPSRSLLSRITDHYMQILANQAPIGFEAEFINQRGGTVLYRGILLPFSRDDETIDYIYGVINWKELADQTTTDALMKQVDEAVEAPPTAPREATLMSEWADGPADTGFGHASYPQPELDLATLDLPVAEFGLDLAGFEEVAFPADADSLSLGDWLAIAREEALQARSSEDRSRRALYDAIGRAYDFALAAAENPKDFAELVEDAGLKMQERAPLMPLVKLVFGADYDKTRLAEVAAAIGHGQRRGVERGALADLLATTAGGLKAVVAEERRLRREESGKQAPVRVPNAALVAKLRKLDARPLDSIASGSEFSVLVTRRLESGQVVLLGEVSDDPGLLDRAARHLIA